MPHKSDYEDVPPSRGLAHRRAELEELRGGGLGTAREVQSRRRAIERQERIERDEPATGKGDRPSELRRRALQRLRDERMTRMMERR